MALGLLLFCITALLCVLSPDQALAWGPGAHLLTGNWLLQNLSALPAGVAAVIMAFPEQFLHGLLGADIFIGKGCKAKKGHSHNWESGFTLLENAQSQQHQAYAYGYLSHLAADTVAHNVFVPGFMHTAPASGKTAHVYLEIQADSLIKWSGRDALALFYGQESAAALDLLKRSMHRKSLPFWLNAGLYKSSIAIGGSRFWRNSMECIDKLLWPKDRREQLSYLLGLSTKAMFNVLQEGSDSKVLELDPVGTDALALAERQAGRKQSLVGSSIRRHLCKTLDRHLTSPLLKKIHLLPSQSADAINENIVAAQSVKTPSILASLPAACGQRKDYS